MNTHTRNTRGTTCCPVLSELAFGASVVMITAALAMVAFAYADAHAGVVIAARVAQLAAPRHPTTGRARARPQTTSSTPALQLP